MGPKGEEVVKKNYKAVEETLANLFEVKVPDVASSQIEKPPAVPVEAPEFVQTFTARIIAGEGDNLPVSAFPVDGTFPTGTAHWEKRNIALEIPSWDPEHLHSVRQMLHILPACNHPHQGLRRETY